MTRVKPIRALVPIANRCPRIHSVDGWVDEAPRVLLRGVDNANFSFAVEVTDEMYVALLAEQVQARLTQRERNAAYCSEWLGARVAPSGVKGYAVLLETERWAIKVQKGNPTRPPLYVELRSLAIHTHPGGVLGLAQEVCAYLRDVLLADASPDIREQVRLGNEKLSRFDLHLDWQGGWHPTLVEQEQRLFIKPGHAKLTAHLEGERCTGYDLGKRRIVARLYNKSVQVKEKGLAWYGELLRQMAGDAYDSTQEVWRLEFELKREGVTGFCLFTRPDALYDEEAAVEAELEAEDLPHLGTLEKAVHWAGRIWHYLTTRWLRLVVPSAEDSNRARWETHPTWQILQQGFADVQPPLGERQAELVRAHRHTGFGRLNLRMGLGIAATAELLLDSDPASVLPAYLEQLCRLAEHTVRKQEEKRDRRRWEGAQDARRRRYVQAMQQLCEMALGVFGNAGVVKAELPRVGSVADLLCFLVDDLEALAAAKGGIGQVLYDKWCKAYKVVPPRGMFTWHVEKAA